MVIGKERINLNEKENWIQQSEFRRQNIAMKPVVIVPPKTKYQDIRKWVLETDEVIVSNPAIVGLPPRAELMILSSRATIMCQQLLSLQDVEYEELIIWKEDVLYRQRRTVRQFPISLLVLSPIQLN